MTTEDISDKVWRLEINGLPKGPFSAAQIRRALEEKKISPETLVFGPRMTKWEPLAWHSIFVGELSSAGGSPRFSVPKATFHRPRLAHDIEFVVWGEDVQFVEIALDPGEATIAEAGAMMYMEDGIELETVFGDETSHSVVDKLVGAGKRLISGESLFLTVFTNRAREKRKVAFAAPYAGQIIPVNLPEFDGELLCQKNAFLCAAKGVSIDIVFQKRLATGLFGGEGFILQRLSGDGLAFVHAGGTLVSRELGPTETLRVDTGCLVALEKQVDFGVEYIGSVKSALFGGEGLFLAKLSGPGTVWLQSLPLSRLAGRIYEAAPQGGGKHVGEGSLLGSIGQTVFSRSDANI